MCCILRRNSYILPHVRQFFTYKSHTKSSSRFNRTSQVLDIFFFLHFSKLRRSLQLFSALANLIAYIAHYEKDDHFLETRKTYVLIESVNSYPYKERPQAPVDFVEFLWNQKGTCKELELPLLSSQLYLFCRFVAEKRDFHSTRRSRGLVLPAAKLGRGWLFRAHLKRGNLKSLHLHFPYTAPLPDWFCNYKRLL